MKEGYLQKKIAEFSEKISTFEHRLDFKETEFERLENQLGGFKQLLKKLKDIETLKDQAVKQITYENQMQIEKSIERTIIKLEKTTKKMVDSQTALLQKTLEQIKKDERIFNNTVNEIESLKEQVKFYQEFHRLFMLKLINKGILNHRELNEVELRAKKRVSQKD
jgi:hypothetical protein